MHHSVIHTHMHTPNINTLAHNNAHIHSTFTGSSTPYSHSHIQAHIKRYINIKKIQHIFTFVHTKWRFVHKHSHTAVHCRPGTDQGEVQADTQTSLMI